MNDKIMNMSVMNIKQTVERANATGINAELVGDTMKLIAVSFADIIPVRIVTEFPASEADAKAKEIADRLLKKA